MSLIEIYDRLVVVNANEPEKFEEIRDQLISKEIGRMCKGNEKCIWKAEGLMRSLKLKHSNIKDPIARCNASLADMWGNFNELNKALEPFRK